MFFDFMQNRIYWNLFLLWRLWLQVKFYKSLVLGRVNLTFAYKYFTLVFEFYQLLRPILSWGDRSWLYELLLINTRRPLFKKLLQKQLLNVITIRILNVGLLYFFKRVYKYLLKVLNFDVIWLIHKFAQFEGRSLRSI